MLSLDSSKWAELSHAYGNAADIPDLLRQLETLPTAGEDKEPWFSIWSSLAHQGDVYTASFAAVPHVIRALQGSPLKADSAYFQFPAWVEICRHRQQVEVPKELEADYSAAFSELPSLVGAAAGREWTSEFTCCALSALAAAKGQVAVAAALLELTPEVAEEFLEWFFNR